MSATLLFAALAVAAAEGDDFAQTVARLDTRDYDEKASVAIELVAMRHDRAGVVLSALMDGQLYRHKDSDQIVIATKADRGFDLLDALTGEDLGHVGRRDVAKIGVNNALRGTLRGLIAQLELNDPDVDARVAAIEAVGISGDESMAEALRSLRDTEPLDEVVAAIDTALALLDLDSSDPSSVLAAIAFLDSDLSAHVRTKLTGLIAESDNEDVRQSARQAIASIEARARRFEFVEHVLFGLSLGSVLVLAAIGLAITFGVMGVINMAHGELIMLGAYTTYTVQSIFPRAIEVSLFVAVPSAFLVSGLVGIGIERSIIRFLYGRPLETLLATFGVSLLLRQSVRSIYSPLNRSVTTPEWMSGLLEIADGLSITYNRLYIFFFALIVFAGLHLLLRKTRLGLHMRAVTQDRETARAMGIRTGRVDALTFGLGSGIAGVAGVALSQLTNVGPNLGQSYIVDSFLVVVFGGVGNLWGTLVSGLSLGVANKFLEPVVGAVLGKIMVLVFIIVFIQHRPRGMFPRRGRAAEA
ncbi:MAG: urea ABC transporter permease subunit UrtB [Acidobacteriota bacterium]|nr:urea ABC transporter permease subunit UrtB [Acidobacteriota bacterium]